MKRLVFYIGHSAGFYSEYNNMVLAILHCMHYKIDFVLYSKTANFGVENGWSDYFLPFCKEVSDSFHRDMNKRFPEKPHTIYFSRYLKCLYRAAKKHDCNQIMPYCNLKIQDSLAVRKLKKEYQFDYFTHDIFYDVRRWTGIYTNRELQRQCQLIVENTYRFNDSTKKLIKEKMDLLPFKKGEYVGLHIRGGDKIIETDLFSPEIYMNRLMEISNVKNVFVFTDDYRLFEILRDKYKDFNFYTLTSSDELGYDQQIIDQMYTDLLFRKERMIFLFSCMEILSNAKCIVGTISSNPGMFLGMRCPEKIYYIDTEEWRIM
ncbi:MAG TPA: hypothetical protein PKW49_07035 [Paludibacteraceae bacterium]|nr:hypothetical protein [Paludibacteraceae bacterium]HQJ89054.1 hypothetical protein [Paludibacteraceae bacterium]